MATIQRPAIGERLSRKATLSNPTIDTEARTVQASLSSEAPVSRIFGKEIVSHERSAVNLERAAGGLPMLIAHDSTRLVGRIHDVHVSKDRRLRGTLRFARTPDADEAFSLIEQGVLRDLSVGYSIDKYLEADDDIIRVVRWTPLECSLVSVPADPSVGINRHLNLENSQMADETAEPTTTRAPASGNVIELAIGNERQRAAAIRQLYSLHSWRGPRVQDMALELITSGASIDQARAALLDYLAAEEYPGPCGGDFIQDERFSSLDQRTIQTLYGASSGYQVRSGRISMGDRSGEFLAAATDALALRCGVKLKEVHPAAQDLRRVSVVSVAETLLKLRGINTFGLNASEIFSRGIIGYGSSDFPNLLANVASKSWMQGYDEEQASHRIWTRDVELRDFKPSAFAARSEAPNPLEVKEQAEYTHGTVGENHGLNGGRNARIFGEQRFEGLQFPGIVLGQARTACQAHGGQDAVCRRGGV